MIKKRTRILRWMLGGLALYGIAVFGLHLLPLSDFGFCELDGERIQVSHLVHVVIFFPWGALGAPFVLKESENRAGRALCWLIAGILLAAIAEGIQYWIPYRSFTWNDVEANLLGVLLGAPLMFVRWFALLSSRQ